MQDALIDIEKQKILSVLNASNFNNVEELEKKTTEVIDEPHLLEKRVMK